MKKAQYRRVFLLLCSILMLNDAYIFGAQEALIDNQAKVAELRNLPNPTTVDEMLSQIKALSMMLPDRLQIGRDYEAEFIESVEVVLDRLVNLFSRSKVVRTPEVAKALSEYILRFNQVVKTGLISNFNRLPTFANVAPPAGSGLAISGSPDTIKDPKLRAQYEKEIAENNRNIAINNLHQILIDENRLSSLRVKRLLHSLGENDDLADKATREKLLLTLKP